MKSTLIQTETVNRLPALLTHPLRLRNSRMLKEKTSFCSSIPLLLLMLCAILRVAVASDAKEEGGFSCGFRVRKEHRRILVSTEYGEISAVRVDGKSIERSYLLHFFTLEPNSLMLPVMLHSDMVFYVYTGSGKLSWTERGELKSANIRLGDAYRLQQGSVLFIQSNLETEFGNKQEPHTERQKLRIHAIFADDKDGQHVSEFRPYTSLSGMVLGFDKSVLGAAFKVPGEVIEDLYNGTETSPFIHAVSNEKNSWEMGSEYVRGLLRLGNYDIVGGNKKSKKVFNILKEAKDFENSNGWSTMVTWKKLPELKGSNIGLFMVNLPEGSMMGPHWNPTANEIAVVLQGQGMVRAVCPSASKEMACKNISFKVEVGDVFAVPRFHPMAQMAFSNDKFVFMGFSTSVRYNYPQYFAGQASVLKTLDKDVVAVSFNTTTTTIEKLLTPQPDSVLLHCALCAEEEWKTVLDERAKEHEEIKKSEEEEVRKRDEAKKREEERKREKEEERKRQEEERKRQQEEEMRKKEEERRRQEEEMKDREERKRQEEEEMKKHDDQDEEDERKRQKEEGGGGGEEEEEGKRGQEEDEAMEKQKEEEKRQQEKDEAMKKQEEERKKRQEEAAAMKKQEEERKRQQEEAAAITKQEEERKRLEEEMERQQEEERKRRQAAAAAMKKQEETERQQEEEKKQRQEAAAMKKQEEERERKEASAMKKQEERERWEAEGARKKQEELARLKEVLERAEEAAQKRQEEAQKRAAQKRQEEAQKRAAEAYAQRAAEEAKQQENERKKNEGGHSESGGGGYQNKESIGSHGHYKRSGQNWEQVPGNVRYQGTNNV